MSKQSKKETEAAEMREPVTQEPMAAEETAKEPDEQHEAAAEKSADDLAKEIESLKAEHLDSITRLQAEFDNFRKRARSERQSAYSDGFGAALINLLPMLDNIERAIATAEAAGAEQVAKGIRMSYDQLMQDLEKQGMTEIEAEGKPFDPSLHNAVMKQPADSEEKSGLVCDVLQKGYEYNGKVLRYSSVRVYE